jgi:inhibitor of cysteine peptidase
MPTRNRQLRHRCSGVYEVMALALLIVSGCDTTDSPGHRREVEQMSTVTLTQADNGRSVEVRPGNVIVIQLAENPTTGFRWAVDQIDEQIVTIVRVDYTTAAGGGIGGGGARSFTLKAEHSGTMELRLKLWRDWEGESSVIERFTVTIQVRSIVQ